MMRYEYLGKEKLKVSVLGFGCWGFSGVYGAADPDEATRTIDSAVEAGINFFDTADIYGLGANEVFVGKVLKGRRKEIVLATKFGFIGHETGELGVCGRPDYVKAACAASLKRLATDYIDLYYLHRIDPQTPIEETVGAMAELVREGNIRFIGLSEASVESIRRARTVHPITALQSEYSLFTKGVETNILPLCGEADIGFVAFSPLGRGILSKNFQSGNSLSAEDYRRPLPRFQVENLKRNLEVIERLSRFAKAKGVSVPQIALAWVLSGGSHRVAIPGMKKIKHLKDNLGSLEISLSAAEIEELNRITAVIHGERHNTYNMKFLDS
jgi:aryl-alcohol dehydrogenase-like predicted oxidoreductase